MRIFYGAILGLLLVGSDVSATPSDLEGFGCYQRDKEQLATCQAINDLFGVEHVGGYSLEGTGSYATGLIRTQVSLISQEQFENLIKEICSLPQPKGVFMYTFYTENTFYLAKNARQLDKNSISFVNSNAWGCIDGKYVGVFPEFYR